MEDKEISGFGGIYANLAPDAFHRWAIHYYACRQDFHSPHVFSPVPYFLLCRSIELELKSRHLVQKKQTEVKNDYGHYLDKAYDALESSNQELSSEQRQILKQASDIYATKGFEYFDPEDALSGYRRYPDLAQLDDVAKKLLGL